MKFNLFKRVVLLLVVAAAVAGAIWYSLRAARGGSPAGAAALLPPQTVALVHIPNVNRTRDDWHHSDLYQLYREPSVQAFIARPLSRMPANMEASAALGDLQTLDVTDGFAAALSFDRLRIVGGFEFGCDKERATAIVSKWKGTLAGTSFAAKQTGVEHEGHQLEILTVGALTVASTFSGNHFFFATDVEDLRSLLDRADGRLKTADLAHAGAYRSAIAHMPAIGYALLVFAQPALLGGNLSLATGASAFCHALRFDGGKMRDVTFVAKPEEKIESLSRGALNIGTAETLLYATAALNPAQELAPATAAAPLQVGFLSKVMTAISAAGVTAQEWNAAFGSELSLLSDWPENTRWPAVFVTAPVKDAARANAIAERVAQSMMPGAWSSNTRDGIQYHTLPTPTGFMVLNPTIAVSDKLLVAGLDPAAVEEAFKRAGNPSGLAPTGNYKAAAALVPTPKTIFAYVDLPLLYRRLDTSLRPLLQMAGALMPAMSEWVDVSKLPPTEVVTKHLSPLVASQAYDRDGYVTESCGTIPLTEAMVAGVASGTAGAFYKQNARWPGFVTTSPALAASPSPTPSPSSTASP